MLNQNLEERIRNLKDKIADARDYISSDFCIRCVEVYKEIADLEQQLLDLQNECDR
jgi:polyhydroxyalkanoate synthesis regulator phasin